MNLYRPRVYAVALRATRNHHDAEDITQDTFLQAFRAGSGFRADSSVGTWLCAIALNLVRNRYWYWRRRKRDKTVSLDEPSSNAGAVSLRETLTTGDPNAATLSEQDDLFKQLEHSMERLPERDRKMLLLRDRHHASYGEIARSLVIPLGTVKSRIAHARVHLREIVRKGISADINLSSRGGRIQGATP